MTVIVECYVLRWHHNQHDSVSNHQPHDCLLNRLFGRKSKKTPKLRVTGLCAGNSPGTGEFPAQRASNAENVSIWLRHHVGKYLDTWRWKKTDSKHMIQPLISRYVSFSHSLRNPFQNRYTWTCPCCLQAEHQHGHMMAYILKTIFSKAFK